MIVNKQFGVKALIERGDSEFLFLLRTDPLYGETKPGYDIPGGKNKLDKISRILENPVTAIYRETYEETGITDLGVLRIAGFQTFNAITPEKVRLTVKRTYFKAQYREGNEIGLNPAEHSDYCWATIEEALGRLPLNPVLEEFLRAFSGNVGGVPTRSQITI